MTSLSPPLQAVVALFRGPLVGVRFADVDAEGLSNLATDVENATAEIEAHEAKLAELRQALTQRHEALLALAQQALAYARIYAENDEALSAELSQIVLPRAAKPRKPSKAPTEATVAIPDVVSAARSEADAPSAPSSKRQTSTDADSTQLVGESSDAESSDAESLDGEGSKARLVNKPKKRYSRVPPQSRAS